MTDEQIIKALECCKDGECRCKECPYGVSECLTEDDVSIILKDAFDLINRQKAEIERLKKEKQDIKDKYDCQQTVYCDLSYIIKEKCKELELANADKVIAETHEKAAKEMFVDVTQQLKTAKSEAIKKFAEGLKKQILNLEFRPKTAKKTVPTAKLKTSCNCILHEVLPQEIDNLLKEMEGKAW